MLEHGIEESNIKWSLDQKRWSLKAIHSCDFSVLWFCSMIFLKSYQIISNVPVRREVFWIEIESYWSLPPLALSLQKRMLVQMLLLIFHLGGIFKYRKQFCKLPAVSVLLGLCRGSNNLRKNSTCVFPGNGFHNIDEFQMKGIYLIQVKWKVLSTFPDFDDRTCSKTIFSSHKNTKLYVNISFLLEKGRW